MALARDGDAAGRCDAMDDRRARALCRAARRRDTTPGAGRPAAGRSVFYLSLSGGPGASRAVSEWGKQKTENKKHRGAQPSECVPVERKIRKKIRLGVQNQNPENCPWEPPSHTVWTAQNDGKMCFEVFFPQNFRPQNFCPQNFRLRRCERVLKVM